MAHKLLHRPLDYETKNRILDESGPALLKMIGRHVGQPLFLAQLVKYKAISSEESQDIADVQKSSEKKQLLLTHLYHCSVQQFINFCIVLHDEADRADILTDAFSLNIEQLRQQRGSQETKATPYPIWDKRHVGQQALVEHTEYQGILQEARGTLTRYLHLQQILPHLTQLDVLHDDAIEPTSKSTAVHNLVDMLQSSPTWMFHALMRACALVGQKHVIEKVGLNPYDYTQAEDNHPTPEPPADTTPSTGSAPQQLHADTEPTASRLQSPRASLPSDLIRIIRDHCETYKRELMRRNLYDYGDTKRSKVIDLVPIYIKVKAQHENQEEDLKEIPESKILKPEPGETSLHIIRLYGPPGVGKSALASHIAHDWSLEFLSSLDQPTQSELDDEDLTTLVYVPARNITGTVEDAIKDHLGCRREDREVLCRHVEHGYGTGVIIEGIDEVRDEAVLKNIKNYIEERRKTSGGPRILVTSRTDMCNFDSKMFDRFLVVEGFTTEQALRYIKAYLEGETLEAVLKFVQENQEKLYPVLHNPLRLHVFCTLVSEGELQLDNINNVSIYSLLELLEKCLLRREQKEVTKEQLLQFYKMALHGLLKGWRTFSEEALAHFKIADACHVFFVKKETDTATGIHVTYSFPHEMLHEYFAGRYLESLSLERKKELLLSICSNPNFRNLQKIVFEMISQQKGDGHELLQTMLRAILIMQHDDSVERKNPGFFKKRFTLCGQLVNLHKKIESPELLEISMLELQNERQAQKVNKIWKVINKAFDENFVQLQKASWYLGLGKGVFGHVTECLQVCPSDLKGPLTQNTTRKLLPCEYNDNNRRHLIYPVGESRWSEVTIGVANNDISVNAWTAEDALEALNQARQSALPSDKTNTDVPLTLNINKYRNLWGKPHTSQSPQQCNYTDELGHWSSICDRVHFSFSADAKVVFLTSNNKIEVHANKYLDAKDALTYLRLSAADSCGLDTFNSINISIDEELPGHPSHAREDQALIEELGHWSHICKRRCFKWTIGGSWHRFICAAGKSRWAHVSLNETLDRIHVNARTTKDASEALYHARASALQLIGSHAVDSLTMELDEHYRHLWGQPPTYSPSPPPQDPAYSQELQHWASKCKRLHLPCSGNMSHNTEVVFHTDNNKIEVLAQSQQDASEALRHVRLSPVYSCVLHGINSITITGDGWLAEDGDLKRELGHWSHFCESRYVECKVGRYHTFVCAVGESRWSEITFDWKINHITVNAWSDEDAKDALYHLRQLAILSRESHMFDYLTLNIAMYRDLWGEVPSSSPSPEFEMVYCSAIGHWMSVCKRIHLMRIIGSRCAEIVFHTGTGMVAVHAWKLEDAREALHQIRQLTSALLKSHNYRSVTLNVKEYQSVWGQPSADPFSKGVCAAISAELLEWAAICDSHHLVYNVGTSRYAEVLYMKDEVQVHAWSLEDARDALIQARLSASHGQENFKLISLNVEKYRHIWGEPSIVPSVESVHETLHDEVQQWANRCNSYHITWMDAHSCHHLVCNIGTLRYAEVLYMKDEVQVHTWSLEDARHALIQARHSAVALIGSHKYSSIKLHVDEYRLLWGQPSPKAFSREACSSVTAELQNWSLFYDGHHLVYNVGTSRYAEVLYMKDEVQVHAWSLEDARDALIQARLSASHGQENFKLISLNVEKYRHIWGEPSIVPSVESVHETLHDEVQQWANRCNSYHIRWMDAHSSLHLVCNVGTSRYAELLYIKDEVQVHAWSLEDARDALIQTRHTAVALSGSHKYSSITLHVDKYRLLWGQPSPKAFSREACSSVTAELQNWSPLYDSHHLVYNVGTSRYAEVLYMKDEVQVHAWSLEDARDALIQTRQTAIALSGSHMYSSIMLHVDKYRLLWGQPSPKAFSREACSSVTAELQNWSPLYDSHHLVYNVGTSRYTEVLYMKDEVQVHAWSLEDARDALIQARLSASHGQENFKLISLNVKKYRHIWGEPSIVPSVESVHETLHDEVQQWANRCNSFHIKWTGGDSRLHILCSVNTNRYSEVFYKRCSITIRAWCIEDASEALQQYRTLIASHKLRDITWFNIDVNQYHTVWGQPPSTAFTQDSWNKLYDELASASHMWAKNCYWNIFLSESAPLHQLLESDARRKLSMVHHGTISLADLHRVVETGQLRHVWRLCNTNIVLPSEGDQDTMRTMRERLMQAPGCHSKLLQEPHFVKPLTTEVL